MPCATRERRQQPAAGMRRRDDPKGQSAPRQPEMASTLRAAGCRNGARRASTGRGAQKLSMRAPRPTGALQRWRAVGDTAPRPWMRRRRRRPRVARAARVAQWRRARLEAAAVAPSCRSATWQAPRAAGARRGSTSETHVAPATTTLPPAPRRARVLHAWGASCTAARACAHAPHPCARMQRVPCHPVAICAHAHVLSLSPRRRPAGAVR